MVDCPFGSIGKGTDKAPIARVARNLRGWLSSALRSGICVGEKLATRDTGGSGWWIRLVNQAGESGWLWRTWSRTRAEELEEFADELSVTREACQARSRGNSSHSTVICRRSGDRKTGGATITSCKYQGGCVTCAGLTTNKFVTREFKVHDSYMSASSSQRRNGLMMTACRVHARSLSHTGLAGGLLLLVALVIRQISAWAGGSTAMDHGTYGSPVQGISTTLPRGQ